MTRHSSKAEVEKEQTGVLAHRGYANALVVPPTSWNMSIDGYRANANKLHFAPVGYSGGSMVGFGGAAAAALAWAPNLNDFAGITVIVGALGALGALGIFTSELPSFLTQLGHRKAKAQQTLANNSPDGVINLNSLPRESTLRAVFEDFSNRPVTAAVFSLACRVEAAGKIVGWTDHDIIAHDPALALDFLALPGSSLDPTTRRPLEAYARAIVAAEPAEASIEALPSPSEVRSRIQRSKDLWAKARQDHESVETAWALIVTDPLSALDHSALLDVTQLRTAAFLKSQEAAQAFSYIEGEHWPGEDKTAQYVQLVRKVTADWTEAFNYSEQAGLHWLSADDAATIARARKMLERALDDRLPPAERALAAQRASETLKGFTAFRLPSESVLALEAVARLQLERAGKSVPEEAL